MTEAVEFDLISFGNNTIYVPKDIRGVVQSWSRMGHSQFTTVDIVPIDNLLHHVRPPKLVRCQVQGNAPLPGLVVRLKLIHPVAFTDFPFLGYIEVEGDWQFEAIPVLEEEGDIPVVVQA